jgi:spore germination protein
MEAFIMEGAIELLREAGVRLPSPIGQTVGIVGGLIIGEAAVSANIVGSVMVITVALTAISSFAVPTYDVAIAFRLLRFFLMIMATFLGLYGVILGLMIILSHMATLKSFGVSYLSPWSPLALSDLKDSLIRAPMMSMRKRPSYMSTKDPDRMDGDRNDIKEMKSSK